MITQRLISMLDLLKGSDVEKSAKIGISNTKLGRFRGTDTEAKVDDFAKMAKFLQLTPVQIYEVLYGVPVPEETRVVRQDGGEEVKFLREQLKVCMEINKNLSKRGEA